MWVLPSRSRPHNIPRIHARTPVLLCLDDDDPMRGGYPHPEGWTVSIGPRAPLSEIYNRAFRDRSGLDWYGIFADDVIPEGDWDLKLIEAAGSDGLSYGDDGLGEGSCTHFCLGGDLVRETGFLALPGLHRIYIDTAWRDIAERRGVLRYLPDVKVIHMHPAHGRGLMDAIYRKTDDVKARDKAIYERFKETIPCNARQAT